MNYHGHIIAIRQGNHFRSHAVIRGPLFTGTAQPLYGGRFSVLLYACRIIREREKAKQ